jgi:hypothetical protein
MKKYQYIYFHHFNTFKNFFTLFIFWEIPSFSLGSVYSLAQFEILGIFSRIFPRVFPFWQSLPLWFFSFL